MNLDREIGTIVSRSLACTAVATLLLAGSPVLAAGGGGGASPGDRGDALTLEPIPGSQLKRVILTAKGAERLGIEIAKVTEEPIIRKQMFGGQVTHPLNIEAEQKLAQSGGFGRFGSFARASVRTDPKPVAITADLAAASGAWIRLMLSPEEWDRVDQDEPATILPLATRDMPAKEITARPSKLPPFHDLKRTMVAVYYVVPGSDHGLNVNDRMRFELVLKGNGKKAKAVPYGALYYDDKGEPWVYASPRPLTYERKRVTVERIQGNTAYLSDGPPVGTEIVSVGSPLLYGAEVIYKK